MLSDFCLALPVTMAPWKARRKAKAAATGNGSFVRGPR